MDSTPQPESAHRRTGMVARLPKTVRDQINHLILDGVPYTQILQKVPEAAAAGVTEDHLSTWRAGGYMDWFRQFQRAEVLQSKHEMAMDLVRDNPGTTLQEASRKVVAAQLCDLLIDFDPVSLLDHLRDKPEFYMRVITALARLSEGELACAQYRAQEAHLKAKLANEQAAAAPNVITPETLKNVQQAIKLH